MPLPSNFCGFDIKKAVMTKPLRSSSLYTTHRLLDPPGADLHLLEARCSPDHPATTKIWGLDRNLDLVEIPRVDGQLGVVLKDLPSPHSIGEANRLAVDRVYHEQAFRHEIRCCTKALYRLDPFDSSRRVAFLCCSPLIAAQWN